MKHVFAFLVLSLALLSVLASNQPAEAGRGIPPNNRAKGLVYDGLQLPTDRSCKGAFKITANGRCTHGPDAAPASMNVAYSVAPATGTSSATASSVVCDGDGVTGKRMQVMYVHAADVPDQYATYLASIQQWTAGADVAFQNSAAETGGTRHVRFVTDASCVPTVLDVMVSTTGDDVFGYTINDLVAQGYNRTDRDYLLFVDAHVYCGISNMEIDDQPGSSNMSNNGQHYSRVDAGCWSDVIAAHEMMHAFGGVQLSAPHSSGDLHCYDQSDVMCRPTNGTPVQNICPNPGYVNFDCNHDDYYSTNPAAGTYLATHWNTANNQFLIGSTPTVRTDSLVTGKLKGKTFTQTDTFSSNDTIVVRGHVVNSNGASLPGATVTLTVNRPDGSPQCTVSAVSDATGMAQGSCNPPAKAPSGTWNAHTAALAATGYQSDMTDSVKNHSFTLK